MINVLRLTQLVYRASRVFLPWIGRIILFMVGLIITSALSFWSGIPQTTDRIANEWLDRAVANGFPTIWDRRLYFTFRILAFAMILLGWVILSYITVWLVHLIL